MKFYRFYKEADMWFIDLPEWEGDKWELQMVSGADEFLEMLSGEKREVWIKFSTEFFPGSEVLIFQKLGSLEGWEMGEGAWYFLNFYKELEVNLSMWLCNVTKFIFSDFPTRIYFS